MEYLTKINKRKVAYSISGKGKTIVFIHGWMDSKKAYDPLISILSSNYRCICIDLPGFGKSETVKNISVNKYTSIINKLLKRIDVNSFYLVGHSLGGAISIVYAKKFPEKVRKLVLISPFVRFSQFPRVLYLFIRHAIPYLIRKKIISPFYKMFFIASHVLADKKIDVNSIDKIKKEKIKRRAVNALKIAFELSSLDLYALLEKIEQDALIVYGNKDSLLKIKPLKSVFGVIENIHLMIFEKTRHYLYNYNTEELAQKITDFFENGKVKETTL